MTGPPPSRHHYSYDEYLALESDSEIKLEITNPMLLVEVLSSSTEAVDRGDKLRDYQRIPSLREYVLVSQEPRVEIYRRLPAGTWEYIDVREGAVTLACGATLDLATLYAGLPA